MQGVYRMRKLSFATEEEFKKTLSELSRSQDLGTVEVITPYPVHGIDEILNAKKSPLKFFTLLGGIAGFLTGLSLTIYTVTAWPINTGGKPIVSMLPFLIIAYALTILLGGLLSFGGFLHLTRLPNLAKPSEIMPKEEYGNAFVILMEEKE